MRSAVEAARAGEYGKGFSVVAEEVRNLAGRSQRAARDTEVLIEDSVERVEIGMDVAKKTADSFETIVENVGEVGGLISQTTEMYSEQADSISQISDEVNKISAGVQNNSAVSEECAAASEELNAQAGILKNLLTFFKLKG